MNKCTILVFILLIVVFCSVNVISATPMNDNNITLSNFDYDNELQHVALNDEKLNNPYFDEILQNGDCPISVSDS